MKHCRKCDSTKSLDEFPNNRAKKDGKAQYCKPCWNAYMRDQATKHKDRKAASDARWLAANHDRKLAQQAAWRAANREQIKARNARYREEHREELRAKNREYQKANPEKDRAAALRRIARKKAATTYVITDKDLRRLISGPCRVTGCTNTNIELDHVIPLARGGSHGVGNLQPLCQHHNVVKSAKTWMEFRVYLSLKAAALAA